MDFAEDCWRCAGKEEELMWLTGGDICMDRVLSGLAGGVYILLGILTVIGVVGGLGVAD